MWSSATVVLACTNKYDTVRATICQNQTYYNPNSGATLHTGGVYIDTLFTSSGNCDSIITLILSQNSSSAPTRSIYATICNTTQGYNFYGLVYQRPGTYTHQVPDATGGCDSIITLHLYVNKPPFRSLFYSICPGDSFYHNGVYFYTDTTLHDTIQTVTGCDSVVTIYLSAHLPTAPMTFANICVGHGGFNFHGITYTLPGLYYDTVPTTLGCSEVYPILVSTAPQFLQDIYANLCSGGSYYFRGRSLTTAGIYFDTIASTGGCDSVIELHLSAALPNVTLTINVCDSGVFTFNNHQYSAKGFYKDTIYSANGCDTAVYLNLTFQAPKKVITANLCPGDHYQFGNRTLTQAGSYIDTIHTVQGCDSITYLYLRTANSIPKYVNGNLCENGGVFTYDGHSYTTPGVYFDTTHVPNGCDTLAFIYIGYYNATQTIGGIGCAGTYYSYGGKSYLIKYPSSIYIDTIKSTHGGCDTTLYINLSSYPTSLTYREDTIHCKHDSYTFRDSTFVGLGDHLYYASSTKGCDSIISIRLKIGHSSFSPAIRMNRNQDSLVAYTNSNFISYQWIRNGITIAGANSRSIGNLSAGSYTLATVDIFGCADTSRPYIISAKPGTPNSKPDDIKIYPNPSNGLFNFTWTPQPLGTVMVYNLLGQLIYRRTISEITETIDLTGVASGTYLIVTRSDGAIAGRTKLIVTE